MIGLRIRDSRTGRVTLDLTDRISRITGNGTATAGVAGSMVIPDYADGTPFFVCSDSSAPSWQNWPPVFSLNLQTGVLSWTAGQKTVKFLVGVY